jgi:small subunit ribosomal protein S11
MKVKKESTQKTGGKKDVAKKAKKSKRVVKSGVAYISCTFNNTIISLTDAEGNLLVQKTPANEGFKGSKKSTAFAATKAARDAAETAIKKYGLAEVKVVIKGPGAGRNAAVKGLDSAGIKVISLTDVTPIPHNGCRPRKKPRK